MRAMILAAGLGTRLKPITDELPKPLVPVVGIPNIVRIITHLKRSGIFEIVINTHHLPHLLEQALGNGSRYGVAIAYSSEKEILGTGGGIKQALPLLGDQTFVVINGDALFTPDIPMVLELHKKQTGLATLLVREDPDSDTYGTVGLDKKGQIRKLVWAGDEGQVVKNYMFTGVHILEPDIAMHLPDQGCIVRKTYIPMLDQGLALNGVPADGYFCDLGTPERFLQANIDLVTGQRTITGYHAEKSGIYVGKHVTLGKNCRLGPGAIVCDHAVIAEDISIERAVVFAGAKVNRSIENAIVTSEGTVLKCDMTGEK
jgi:NDP-sugar pyrophosphorylase family protein